LAVSPAADHIQVGSSGVGSLEHVHTGLRPARPNHEREKDRDRETPRETEKFMMHNGRSNPSSK